MGRGKCSAILVSLGFTLLVCSASVVAAETHVVGDSKGWGFSMSYDSWSSGKTFAAGDTLVFNYQGGVHNVVAVSESEYRSCKVRSASDMVATSCCTAKFELKKGVNYFICGVPGHCAAGMKIRVVAN
ncbi:hypothetical protein HU200_038111 [Digitaria exilis]|uniref:Phytocyanin domain-containing protein n=1 Tax=Digitaria exilis TaxID=1010633 RepID=A0A835EKQ7_9POAL|nr:hypothetical protein HU200_038111 [Digitaria exilis]